MIDMDEIFRKRIYMKRAMEELIHLTLPEEGEIELFLTTMNGAEKYDLETTESTVAELYELEVLIQKYPPEIMQVKREMNERVLLAKLEKILWDLYN